MYTSCLGTLEHCSRIAAILPVHSDGTLKDNKTCLRASSLKNEVWTADTGLPDTSEESAAWLLFTQKHTGC